MASPVSPGYSVDLDDSSPSSGFTPAAATPDDMGAGTSPALDNNYTPPATADVALPPPSPPPPADVPPRVGSSPRVVSPPRAGSPPRAATPFEPREEAAPRYEVPTARGFVWEWLRAHWLFVLIVAVLLVVILILGLKNKCEACPECQTLSQSDIETACQNAGNKTSQTVRANYDLLVSTQNTVDQNLSALSTVAPVASTATKSQVDALQADTTAIQEKLQTIEEDARHCVPPRTQLTEGVSKEASTLHVKSAKDFPPRGLLSVGMTQELIRYGGHTDTMFFNLTRGCSGSVAMIHLTGKDVVLVDPATGTCLKPPPTLKPLAKSFWFIPTSGHVAGLAAGPIPLHYDKVEALTNEDPKTNVVTTVHSIVGASIFLPPTDTTDARHGVKWTLPRPILCEQSAYLPVKFGPLQGNITCMFE